MNIGFDLDGVLYDYHSILYREVTYFMGVTCSYEEFWTTEVHSYNEIKQDFLFKLPHIYSSLVPTKRTMSLLNNLSNKNEIYYFTARPDCVKETTIQYLNRYKFPYRENLYFTDNKTKECRYFGIDVYIEDMLKHALPLSIFCTVYLVDKPWNKQELNKNIIRINHIYELENILL